jgi:hypothetical protein
VAGRQVRLTATAALLQGTGLLNLLRRAGLGRPPLLRLLGHAGRLIALLRRMPLLRLLRRTRRVIGLWLLAPLVKFPRTLWELRLTRLSLLMLLVG